MVRIVRLRGHAVRMSFARFHLALTLIIWLENNAKSINLNFFHIILSHKKRMLPLSLVEMRSIVFEITAMKLFY